MPIFIAAPGVAVAAAAPAVVAAAVVAAGLGAAAGAHAAARAAADPTTSSRLRVILIPPRSVASPMVRLLSERSNLFAARA
jgi:hypothetical protein